MSVSKFRIPGRPPLRSFHEPVEHVDFVIDDGEPVDQIVVSAPPSKASSRWSDPFANGKADSVAAIEQQLEKSKPQLTIIPGGRPEKPSWHPNAEWDDELGWCVDGIPAFLS